MVPEPGGATGPSFSIIKDEKAKDKVGVGDKPPPSSFNNLINFDPI